MTFALTNASLLAQNTNSQNFTPQLSAKLTTSGTSASVTFTPITGTTRQTFMITNKGTKGAYVAWGSGSATAIASTTTPAAACTYIAAGAILTQDYQSTNGTIIDTLAAIQGADSQDNGATILEISLGFGQ